MFRAKIACMHGDTNKCIELHEGVINDIKKMSGDKEITPLCFPFYQACIVDFKEIGEAKLALKYNNELVISAEKVFGKDNIFYLGYTFDYYAQLMSENFNLGF